MKIHSNASSSDFAEGSFFSMDAKAEAAAYGFGASAGFNVSIAEKSTKSSYEMNCYIHYIFVDQQIQLEGVESQGAFAKQYYKCMMPAFRKAYDAIMAAKDQDAYLSAYNKFVRAFGDGCVTRLYLASGSACKITVRHSKETQATKQSYGGSVGLNTPAQVGGSFATQWGKDMEQADSDAMMDVAFVSLPEDSPTKDWAKQIVGQYAGNGINILAEKANAPKPPEDLHVKAPEVPEAKAKKKKVPTPELTDKKGVERQIIEDMKKQDGFTGSNDEYIQEQARLYDELTAVSVVEDAKQLPAQDTPVEPTPVAEPSGLSLVTVSTATDTEDMWDLGGYIPVGYEVTPWATLFPDLKLDLPPSMSSIYKAKLWTFFLTRLEFSQYLWFLVDVGGKLCENVNIHADASLFAEYCEDFNGKITDDLRADAPFTETNYTSFIRRFEEGVKELKHFSSQQVYEGFFNQYELFKNNPLGFIPVIADANGVKYPVHAFSSSVSANKPDTRTDDKDVSVATMLENHVMRLYPILKRNGRFVFVAFDQKTSEFLKWLETGTRGCRYLPHAAFRQYEWSGKNVADFYEVGTKQGRFYGAGFDDVQPDVPVTGAPMLGELPFDKVKGGVRFKGFGTGGS